MRAIPALLLLAAAVAGGAFFAGNPGQIEIVWQGWQIDTSVGVSIAVVALLVLIVSAVVATVAALRRVPDNFRRRRAARRQRSGDAALTNGLVALAAGDAAAAQRHAARAATFLAGSPTALLLTAEAAQRQGDAAAAQQAYTALLARPDTEFLGLRGLIGQALRASDDAAALRLGERAQLLRPGARWLADSLVVLHARGGDWPAARDTLAQAARHGALAPETARHQRGVVLYELSRAAERRGELRRAAALAAKAQAQAPDIVAVAAHHARLLIELGRKRAAAKAIERAWRTAPHPELARAYCEIEPEAGPVARAAAVQRLAAHNPDAAESRVALAEAALDAGLWGEARRHLELAAGVSAPAAPSRRLCLAMARLEENGAGNMPAARQWLDRAIAAPSDPCYVCSRCGAASAGWQALCGECGSFDTLVWRIPERRERALAAAPMAAAAPLMLAASDLPGASRLAPAARSDN